MTKLPSPAARTDLHMTASPPRHRGPAAASLQLPPWLPASPATTCSYTAATGRGRRTCDFPAWNLSPPCPRVCSWAALRHVCKTRLAATPRAAVSNHATKCSRRRRFRLEVEAHVLGPGVPEQQNQGRGQHSGGWSITCWVVHPQWWVCCGT